MLKNLRMKVISCLALALGVVALSAGAALADGTAPTTGATEASGAAGATGASGAHTFNCDTAKARLSRVDDRIAKIEVRIASGHVKDPTKAAARLAAVQGRAGKISAHIAKRC